MIPELHRDKIVSTGLDFLKALAQAYGSDRSLAMFEEMTKIVDPEIHSAIIMAMLTDGNTGSTLRINSVPKGVDRIEFIRALRTWDVRVLDLKAARDMLHTLENGGFVDLSVHHNNLETLRHRLKTLGCGIK